MSKRYLITSALPYINGIKHLGNLIGSMLPADVYSRFLKQCGHEVLYICGTDEHGTPAELAAGDRPIEEYCNEMYETQKGIYERFHLDFDYFGRSSSKANHELTVEIFNALNENGFLEKKTIKQYYSPKDGRFLPDRYVMGTCPKCGYEKARGDQCDGCSALLDPMDLVDPYSSISGDKDLELRESDHYFLKLQDLQGRVEEWVDSKDNWPKTTKGIAKKWLKEGLKERCITRDLKWGINVPGTDKVFYVWFDAPNAYISMTKEYTQDWEKWWKDSDETIYTQFMAKDNVAFHAIFWPAVLMGTGKDFKLVDTLKSMNWLKYDGGKFSTSEKRGVFMDQALELFPADYWRYYLMASIPETDDTDFTFESFAQVINKDLADVLGNFINRVSNLVDKYFGGKLPFHDLPSEFGLESKISEFKKAMEGLNLRSAMAQLRAIWQSGNEYIAEKEPWKLIKEDEAKTAEVLSHCVYLIYVYAILTRSIMPKTAEDIMNLLVIPVFPAECNEVRDLKPEKKTNETPHLGNASSGETAFSFDKIKNPPKEWQIQKANPLFKKVSDEEVAEYTEKFAGQG